MIETDKVPELRVTDVIQGPRSDFASLLGRSRQGDEPAFTLLVRAYEPALRKTSSRILGRVIQSEIDTEDLIQLVHWNVWLGLREGRFAIDSAESLLAVARSILRRKVARVWRTLERRRRLQTTTSPHQRSRGPLTDPNEPTRQISAEDQFEHLCKLMTSTERRLIELRLLGYTTAEAAREMGREPESLRVTLARLRAKLRASGILGGSREAKTR